MKPKAKSRTDGQKLHVTSGRVCKTKQSPILPELQTVNIVDTCDKGYRSYLGRSGRNAPAGNEINSHE